MTWAFLLFGADFVVKRTLMRAYMWEENNFAFLGAWLLSFSEVGKETEAALSKLLFDYLGNLVKKRIKFSILSIPLLKYF